jgi:hypothetical protein
MVFHMRKENNRALLNGIAVLLMAKTAFFKTQDSLQFVHYRCHARSKGDNNIAGSCMDVLFNLRLCMMIAEGHAGAGFAGFSMGIGYKRPENSGKFIFNGPIQPTTGYPVEIMYFLPAIGRHIESINSCNILSEAVEIFFQLRHQIQMKEQRYKRKRTKIKDKESKDFLQSALIFAI